MVSRAPGFPFGAGSCARGRSTSSLRSGFFRRDLGLEWVLAPVNFFDVRDTNLCVVRRWFTLVYPGAVLVLG